MKSKTSAPWGHGRRLCLEPGGASGDGGRARTVNAGREMMFQAHCLPATIETPAYPIAFQGTRNSQRSTSNPFRCFGRTPPTSWLGEARTRARAPRSPSRRQLCANRQQSFGRSLSSPLDLLRAWLPVISLGSVRVTVEF